MAPPLRVQFPGALYHVTARGNERKPIFCDERDRPAQVRKYLSQYLSADAQGRSAWPSGTAADGEGRSFRLPAVERPIRSRDVHAGR